MIKLLVILIATIAIFSVTHPVQAQYLGGDVNADVDGFGNGQMSIADIESQNPHVLGLPMFNATNGDHSDYWNAMVEQYEASQLDFIAVWLKGNSQPATFANFVTAVNLRNQASPNRLKILPFDDNPASWSALWNYDNGYGYDYTYPFDMSNTANWTNYIWHGDLLTYFQNVPAANRFEIDGRPVWAIWSAAPLFVSNLSGNGSKMLAWVRQQCESTFGFNPYIMVPEDWIQEDPSSAAAGVVDGVYPWYSPDPNYAYATWDLYDWNSANYGCAVPQYNGWSSSTDNDLIIDPQHGQTLANSLQNTVGAGGLTTFVEGFDDYWENTECWRAANISSSGSAIAYSPSGFDYPNERINILRQNSNNPYPMNLTEQGYGCDTFSGGVSGGGVYRNGNIALQECGDTGGGWNVYATQKGQSLNWQQVPIEGTVNLLVRAATEYTGQTLHFVIDGVTYPSVTIPNTGGWQTYATVNMGSYTFPFNSTHAVSLVWDYANININWWQVQQTAIPNGVYKITGTNGWNALGATGGGTANGTSISLEPYAGLPSQQWYISAIGNGNYSIRSMNSNGSPGSSLNDTGCTGVNGTQMQLWTYGLQTCSQFNFTLQPDGFASIDSAMPNSSGGYDVLDGEGASGSPGTLIGLWTWDGFPNTAQQEWSLTPLYPLPVASFHADAITGLSNGASVTTWSDNSGDGYNATVPGGSNPPIYTVSAINGLPAVQFNQSSSQMLSFNRPVQNDFTITCVYQSTQGLNGGDTSFFQGAGLVQAEMPGVVNDFGLSLNGNGSLLAGTGNPDTTAVSNTGYNDGKPHIVTFERQQATGAITLFVDGVQVAAAVGGTQALTTPTQIGLGATVGGVNYLTGDIGEADVYNCVLTTTARQHIEGQLMTKWGIGVAPVTALHADAITGVANGASLTQWNDLSGNNNDAFIWDNADGIGNPTYVANAINGLPAVEFNSSLDDILAVNSPVKGNFTITCVFESTQGLTTSDAWYSGAALVDGNTPLSNDFGLTLNANGQVLSGEDGVTANSGDGYNNGNPHVATFERDESTGATTLFVDGVQVGTATGGSTQPLLGAFLLGLGGDASAFSGISPAYLTGDIGEVDIYPAVLSTAQREEIESKLMTKWGIP